MRAVRKVSLLVAAVVAVASLGAPAAVAQTPQGDNVAVAQNTKDNSNIFDLSFNIRRVMAGAVDIDNAAVAVSSCESCRTIALAIQVVLIFSDPDVVTTDNLALALNIECQSCETMALAYQYVLTTDGPVHFTGEGNKTITDILRQIREIATDEELSLEEIAAQVDPLVDQLYEVVDTDLVAAGQPSQSEEEQEETQIATPAPTSPETDTSPDPVTTTPTEEVTPAAEQSPSDTTSPGSESPTPEPTPTTTE